MKFGNGRSLFKWRSLYASFFAHIVSLCTFSTRRKMANIIILFTIFFLYLPYFSHKLLMALKVCIQDSLSQNETFRVLCVNKQEKTIKDCLLQIRIKNWCFFFELAHTFDERSEWIFFCLQIRIRKRCFFFQISSYVWRAK